jgi:hypothetical protein
MPIARAIFLAACIEACCASTTTRPPAVPAARAVPVQHDTAKRSVRVGELDSADTRFPEDWRAYDGFTLVESPRPSRSIRMVWQSAYLDGHIWLVVESNHVYVHSGHDNPNPNYLYWVGKSTSVQLATLERIVRGRKSFDCIPVGSLGQQCSVVVTHRDARTHTRDEHLATAAANIAELFETIHRSWPADVPRLELPAARDLDPRVRFGWMREDLDDLYTR